MNKLGIIIKNERKKRGISQVKLGELVGVNDRQISNYEKGICTPPADILLKLSDLFDCTTDYLLGRTDSSNGHVTEINIDGNNIKITSTKPITEKEAYEFFKQYIGK